MRRCFIAPFVSIILLHLQSPSSALALTNAIDYTQTKNSNANVSEGILSSAATSSSAPIVIHNAINNATAIIVHTEPVGDIPAKTWISFDDGPLVEVDNNLSLEDQYFAYDKNAGKNERMAPLFEPFPFVDPISCVFNGTTIVKANVTSPKTLSCESPRSVKNARGVRVPMHISNNGGHDVTTEEFFVYLSSQKKVPLVLTPNHGNEGTRVVVTGISNGTAFIDGPRALCKFGRHISHAIEVGSNGDYVVCVSPLRSVNNHASLVPVEISVRGSNVFSGDHVVFRYDEEFSVASLHPSSGLVIGGNQVKIRGGPFNNPDEIQCRFGKKIVNATYHDVREISCISPSLGWIDEMQRISIFTMAANPEIQTISANVDDYVNEVHSCRTFADSDITDDGGKGFRLVAPGGSIEYPLSHHTRWIAHNETADGFKEALAGTGLFPNGFTVNRTGPFPSQAYKWEIILPKNETFDGETLHVVNTGGGAVRLKGTNASVSCELDQRGTKKLDGHFKLSFTNNSGSVESSRAIRYNATNEEIKAVLEELQGIDVVEVNSVSLDVNKTGSDAFEYHVTFDSLKNAGDLPLLTAEYASSDAKLLGSNAAISIKETRKGSSHAIYRIDTPSQATGFSILLDGVESQVNLGVGAKAAEVVEAMEAMGSKSIVVEKYQDEYYFIDIMGRSLDDRLKAKFFHCDEGEFPPSCPSSLQTTTEYISSTNTPLDGYFTLTYPISVSPQHMHQGDIYHLPRTIQSTTDPISVFATAIELESALQKLDLVDQVKAVVTESELLKVYKLPTQSGIVGQSRNFYIHFLQKNWFSSDLDDTPLAQSTSYSGDLPLLEIDSTHLTGTPTRDSAYSNDYNAKVIEVVKGTDTNHGGSVEVAVSINNGHDWSSHRNPLFIYNPIPIVQSITPAYGSIVGGTAIRVEGDNFSRDSAKFCVFWGIGASNVNGGMIQVVPISKYSVVSNSSTESGDGTIGEVICTTPASLKPQFVHVVVVANEDVSTLNGSLQTRGELFRYHEEIKISSIYPASSTVAGNVSIDISGGEFFSNEGLFCRFGETVVPGMYQSPNQVTCHTPPHAAGSYALEVSQNGQDFTTSGHVIRFYHICNVTSISPISGPSTRAGTNVKVFGENFVNSTSLQCRFGSTHVPATFVYSSMIYCSAPGNEEDTLESIQFQDYYPQNMKGRLVSFEVSNNGQDFTSSDQEFLYLADIEVTNFLRREGPSHGGTPIFVSGSNFVNSTHLMCRFGKETTRAHFLTHEAVLCFSPAIHGDDYLNSVKKKAVPLAVTNNAEDYVFFGAFTYTSSIPSGTYQAGTEGNDTLLSCPRGAYCNENLLHTNFTLCDPGTYQPLAGQSKCIQCPVGYVCNEFGMTVPRICPANYICDERGMDKPRPCPTNYICEVGTATLATACLKGFDFGSETCFDNSTDDFGLQSSEYPAQIWAERHLMPLDVDVSIVPKRGRFCLDNSCFNFEDSDNFEVFDPSFDYASTGFELRRPNCVEGTGCKPDIPPLSSRKSCSIGHYCRAGTKKPCTVGAYCPHDHVFDPLPCEPGTFNFMVGQEKCSECPIGYYCPSYGLVDPTICPPGLVCSKKGLASPNIRCPAGFYCLNGTKTSDPFRNDTTLRPYACSPGTFCFAGTGYNEVREDIIGYAQPCHAGFFCEAASPSAKGSGACPPSFECPRGTANPRPTPKGFYAEHPGTIESTACLPGFYAPTIQTDKCYECPPGTSCMFEGLFEAEDCGPGTYRSTNDESGYSCLPCPQGTWSKNWGLREQGECIRCPTGVVCPLDGMTNPCSYSDLPTPYEPVVNSQGMPALEYLFSTELRPPPFSMAECHALNSNTEKTASPEYYYGELVPPYIDILGRGPHFRASDQDSLKYQREAKCYRNLQPEGSLVYMRMADYYGPQYDIQTGFPHQGYGISLLNNQIYATAPPEGFDFSFTYFRGEGNGYIDLPKARVYDPAFNCTKGIQLMNSSLVIDDDVKRIVYTDPVHDFEGGYDVEKCPTFDSKLDCYIDETYEMHAKGECCNVHMHKQRAVYLAHDQFYRGTCEADIICSEGGLAPPQAMPCDYGFVCDEKTTLESSLSYRCPAGFVCDFGTTPDTKLSAPGSQLKQLCPAGSVCGSDDLGQPSQSVCPKNHWCPTGTADPLIGSLANDSLLRLLDFDYDQNRTTTPANLVYQYGDTFALLGQHDDKCTASNLPNLESRFQVEIHDQTNVNYLVYLSEQDELPIPVNEATQHEQQCSRDNKSAFVRDAMRRKECNCHSQFFTLASVYRFWKCTSDIPLDDLGLGDIVVPPTGHGLRDFWFPNSRIHKDLESGVAINPGLEVFGLQYGEGNVCQFPESKKFLTLTQGRLPNEDELPQLSFLHQHSSGYLDLGSDNDSNEFSVRFTSEVNKVFGNYEDLKSEVRDEYYSEREQIGAGNRSNIDPFLFDLHNSIRLIEQFGEKLEQFIYLNATNITSATSIELVFGHGNDTYSQEFDFLAPHDWCECQTLLQCPNATASKEGSTSLEECVSTKREVLHRISLLPPVDNLTTHLQSTLEGTVDDSSTLHLDPFDVAILTIDQSRLPHNLTYGDHYQISIYDGCKPCPIRYQCKQRRGGDDKVEPPACHYPPKSRQVEILNQCLKQHRINVCLRSDGVQEEVQACQSLFEEGVFHDNGVSSDGSFMLFSEPDLDKCLSRPYFCSDTSWNFLSYRRLCQDKNEDGTLSAIYDCSDVHRWQTYTQWRNQICCAQVPELRGINTCQSNATCVDDPNIESIIREQLIGVFELEYGYIPPTEQPKGTLLMNATLQEEVDNDYPLDLFNEYQEKFDKEAQFDVSLHNKYKAEQSHTWLSARGCCECHRHSMPFFFANNIPTSGYPDDKHQPLQLTISALAQVELTVVVELIHGAFYTDFSDYFGAMDKTMLRVHSPERFAEESDGQATWLTVIEHSQFDKWDLDLPLNLPFNINEYSGIKEMENRFLVDRPSNVSIGDHRLVNASYGFDSKFDPSIVSQATSDPIRAVLEEEEWWPTENFIALPYLPFFSNCDGYDSHISLSRLLEEHPDCDGVNYDQTVPTKEYSFRGNSVSDTCQDVVLYCTYEEEVREARKNLRWYEASPGTTLFRITRDAVNSNEFAPTSADEEWGRTYAIDAMRNHKLIPVTVDKEMRGYRHAIPRKVQLELKYFQMSRGRKRLVEARMYFYDLCTTQQPEHFGGSLPILDMMQERGIFPCDVDINGNMKTQNYDLDIKYYSLGWFDLLNRFEFGGSVYFVFFTLVGLTICSMGGFVYVMNRLLTKLRHPPRFMGTALVKLVSRPQVEGVVLAVIPYMTAILMIHSLFSDSNLFGFNSIHQDWLTGGRVGAKEQIANAIGRLGSAFVVLGSYSTWRATQKLIVTSHANRVHDITTPEKNDDSGLAAKRLHFIWIGLTTEALLMCLLEFSYSDIFRNHIYRFKVLFQMCQMVLDLVMSQIMGDRLLAAPFLVSIQMAELLITIGARNFVEFTLSFLVEVALSVVQRLFLYPLIKTVLTLWPRWKLLAIQAFGNKGLTRQQKQEQELRWKKVNEDIELKSEGIEPLLDSLSIYSVDKTGGIMLPFMCLLLMLLYNESEMAVKYNINKFELLYYCLFALYMIPWMSLVDTFILSSQELLYGWRVYDYFSYQRWRFANRESRWNLLSHVDESVSRSLQNVDLLCFSSQHYFILSIIALGFGTNMLGVTICLRRQYNFLGDPVFPFIVAIVITCCELIVQLCVYISNTSIDVIYWGGIWKVAHLQGTMDDVIASKLAIGEGRQEDLERERQELEAMNNETFRHTFIEKNRPWVLQHLVELMTPRSLQDVGPDGRPLVDYVRDVYSNLMNAGEGFNRRADDRSDISSDDDSDEEEERRRQWDRTPLEGSQLQIARIWLQAARKRRVFTNSVTAIIEKRKEDHCSSCSRTAENCKTLTAGLAWNGRFDVYAIDSLIKQFENSYSPEESDPTLWKAFFRENARFSTICNICLDQIEQMHLHKDVRHVGAGVPTRPGDISSDDESDDDVLFDPVIVSRSSDEGRMMSKWLQAARDKLGGEFPRQEAEQQTDQYLERLKRQKSITNKRASTKGSVTENTEMELDHLEVDEKGEVMIKRWLCMARKGAVERFDECASNIRSRLERAALQLDMKDDWKHGELRLTGSALKMEGDMIKKRGKELETQVSKHLEELKTDFEVISDGIQDKKKDKKHQLDSSVSSLRALSISKKESRTIELNKKIDDLQENQANEKNDDIIVQYDKEIAALRVLIETEMKEEDEQLQLKTNELTSQFSDQMKVLERELQTTLQSYETDCQVLRNKTRKEYVHQEREWQKNVNEWLGKVDRVKSGEHSAEQLPSAKKIRLEQRRRAKRNDHEEI